MDALWEAPVVNEGEVPVDVSVDGVVADGGEVPKRVQGVAVDPVSCVFGGAAQGSTDVAWEHVGLMRGGGKGGAPLRLVLGGGRGWMEAMLEALAVAMDVAVGRRAHCYISTCSYVECPLFLLYRRDNLRQ